MHARKQEQRINYDIIGDIHGHAVELKALLAKLGYRETRGAFRHPDREAVFVGDFIDRGARQAETLRIVRSMVDAGRAYAVMGNHEFNAIAYFLPDPANPGEYLRKHHSPKHGDKNFRQHKAFLAEFTDARAHEEAVNWFLTLPLWLDLPGLRVVHACWHPRFMDRLAPYLSPRMQLNPEMMLEASRKPDDEAEMDNGDFTVFKGVEAVLKGLEIALPEGFGFTDKDGIPRTRTRIRWWDAEATTYQASAILDEDIRKTLPSISLPPHALPSGDGTTPTFFGHYWLEGLPREQTRTAMCLDYSVAKGGKLVAYRWDGEAVLDGRKIAWVGGV
jgi:hypothetical protein